MNHNWSDKWVVDELCKSGVPDNAFKIMRSTTRFVLISVILDYYIPDIFGAMVDAGWDFVSNTPSNSYLFRKVR